MQTFILGILILVIGYIFYSKYVDGLFAPGDNETPANRLNDGVDYVPMNKGRNSMIHLLNIAGMGPIIGAVQGCLFGPIALILIPFGCVVAGAVHDYIAGFLSVKNNGEQITELIKRYMGNVFFGVFILIVSILLLLIASVFVYTSGDLFVERFFDVKEFSFLNPVIMTTYLIVILYFIASTLFPIDKFIGKIYPVLGGLLILGTGLVLLGFFDKGLNIQNFDFAHYNLHPKNLPIIPMFFMTVSCGLLSGFHATQATIISRTVNKEKDSKRIFYGMMCLESLIAIIWAVAAMDVYNYDLVPQGLIGTVSVVNIVANKFVPFHLASLVTLAVIVLPITSGDTALRGLRITIAEVLKINQKNLSSRLFLIMPIVLGVLIVLFFAKSNPESFSVLWKYCNFFNQLIAIPTLCCGAIYLGKLGKNYFVALLPALFYVFITMSFIFSQKIGFNLPLQYAEIIGFILAALMFVFVYRKIKENNA